MPKAEHANKVIKRVLIIVLFVIFIALLGTAGLGGWLYYLYHHPESLKPLLERTVSRLTGISLRMDGLTYSLDPLTVQCNGISIHQTGEIDLKIEGLNLEMERTVLGKRKTLLIKKIDLRDISGTITKIPVLPVISSEQKKPSSIFSALINKIREAFLFQDLKFGLLQVHGGLIEIQTKPSKIFISRIMVEMDAGHSTEMSFGLRVEYGKDIVLSTPEIRIGSDTSLLDHPDRIPLDFSTNTLSYHGPHAVAESSSLKASLIYDSRQKLITLESFHVVSPKILINPGSVDETPSPLLEITAGGNIDLRNKKIINTNLQLNLGSLITMKALLNGYFGVSPKFEMEIRQGVLAPEKLRLFIPQVMKDKLDPFHLEGNAFLSGHLTFSNKNDFLPVEGRIKADLEQNRFSYKHEDTKAEGILNGSIYLNGSWPDPEVKVDIQAAEAGLANPHLKIASPSLELQLEGKHPLYRIKVLAGKITTLNIQTGQRGYVIENIVFKTKEGQVDLKNNRFHLSIQELASSAFKNLALDFTLNRKKDSGAKFLDLASWRIDLKGAFREFDLHYVNDFLPSKGYLSGDIQLKGQWPRYKALAGFNTREARIHGPWGSFSPSDLKLILEIKHPQYFVHEFKMDLAQAEIRLGGKKFPVADITFEIPDGFIDLRKKTVAFPKLTLTAPPFGKARLSLKGSQDDFELQMKSEDSHLLKSVFSWNLLPQDWQVNTDETIEIKASLMADGHCAVASRLSLDHLNLSNNDSTIMGENISLHTSLTGELDIRTRHCNFNLDLLGQTGEFLMNQFYFNFNTNPFSLDSLIKVDIPLELLDISRLNGGLKDIVSLNMNGQIRKIFSEPDFQFYLFLPRIPIGPVFNNFIRDPYQSKKAALKDLDINGTVSADLKVNGNKEINGLKGRLTIDKVDLGLGSHGLNLKGINLELPLWYEKQTLKQAGPALGGRLSIDSIAAPWIPEQSLSIKLEATQNQLSVNDSTEIAIPGGIARIGPVHGRHIFNSPVIETSLTLNNIELKPWFDRIGSLDMPGALSGRLSPVVFTEGRLEGKGEMTASIAGGEINLSNIHISRLNTPTPVFGLDGSFQWLNLAEITTNTPFGKIQGLLEGHINDLEIAYGQPQRFDLLLETVKEKGIPQRISVKAVENIAKLGGGQSPFMGMAGLFLTFLKDFPYQKIGLRASLNNDIFRINGTIKENGQEYIVKRGLYGVNIINRDPNNRIRFKDMVKRIKNLDLSKTKPVIR